MRLLLSVFMAFVLYSSPLQAFFQQRFLLVTPVLSRVSSRDIYSGNSRLCAQESGEPTEVTPISIQSSFNERVSASILSSLLATSVAISVVGVHPLGVNAKETAFLKEPTDEFKADEARTRALRDREKKVKADFDVLLQKFIDAPETNPEETENNIRNMIKFIRPLDGVPTGLKKKDIVLPFRAKKFSNEKRKEIKSTWTKECEIAYVELIQLYNRKVNPDNGGAGK